MASNWNEELERYERGRSFDKDLKASVKTFFSAVTFIASNLPSSEKSQKEEYRSPIKYSCEKRGFFRHKDGFN